MAVSVALAAAWGNSFRLSPPGGDLGSGHKNLQHTVRYTEMAPDGFNFSEGLTIPGARGRAGHCGGHYTVGFCGRSREHAPIGDGTVRFLGLRSFGPTAVACSSSRFGRFRWGCTTHRPGRAMRQVAQPR